MRQPLPFPDSLAGQATAPGLRANLSQFLLLILITAFVGSMLGSERTVIADIAKNDFGIAKATIALSFIISFGVVKALANLSAGGLADALGRRGVLLLGWLAALPVPILVMVAPNWWWIVGANTLLGLNQGLTWSTTIIMKMDLVKPHQRGAAVGINEFTGYSAIALTTLLAAWIASSYSIRPGPFFPPLVFALLGLLATFLFVRDTHHHARREARQLNKGLRPSPYWQVFLDTTWRDPTMRSASQAGLVTKMNDALMWGLLPLLLDHHGLSKAQIALVAAIYPATWGFFQLFTGALSDRIGRKPLITVGMTVQALGVVTILTVEGFALWALGAAILGFGTALAYPTLLATISDLAEPSRRASALGVYRLWRDSGFAWGALFVGVLADAFTFTWALTFMALLSLASSLYAARSMPTRPLLRSPLETSGLRNPLSDSPQ